MNWLTVLPSIHARRTRVCLDSMAPEFREHVLVVDNTRENRGVARSWNIGADLVLEHELDWLVILSAGVRFGVRGGVDFLLELRDADEETPCVEAGDDIGWHLLAFRRQVLERVGLFDEQFFPAYCEDLDWSIRYQRAHGIDSHASDFVGPLWPKVDVDAKLIEVAHGIKRAGVVVDLEGMRAKLATKWGACEEYATPYADPTLDWTYTGPPR